METKLIYCALQPPNRVCSSQCNTPGPGVQRVHNAVNLFNKWVLAGKYCSYKNDIFIGYYIPGVFGYFFCVSMTCDMMSSTSHGNQPVYSTPYIVDFLIKFLHIYSQKIIMYMK